MRSLQIILILISTFSVASAFAEGSKSEGSRTVHETPHPPHDHPTHDHMKKLDEGMNRRRKNETD